MSDGLVQVEVTDAGVGAPIRPNALDTDPGYFRMRWGRGMPWVPARLWRKEVRDEGGDLMADTEYFASIDQEEVDASDPPGWPWIRIEQSEYRYLVDLAAWSRVNDPDGPAANPRRPIKQSTIEFY